MPKRKKLTPEEIQAQFEAWKNSSEYEYLQKLRQMKNELPELMEITPDLMGKWQPFLDEFIKITQVFKIKGAALKSLPQEQLRTTFFGGVNKRDEPFEIDGFTLDFPNKEVPKSCRHIKNNFVEILKNLDELDDLDKTNYIMWKQNKIIFRYKEFVKFLKEHIKKDKGHTDAKNILNTVLDPLKSLMEATLRLSIFEVKHTTKKAIEEHYFQYKALLITFAEKYQPCQTMIFTSNPDILKSNPDIYSVYKKIDYEGWESNPFEKSYIYPLQEALNKMKANLIKLYSLGFDFWKQPIAENRKFLKDVTSLVEKEELAEYLLGNILSREQTNFIYKICMHLHNSKAKESLLNKDTKLLDRTLPQLTILRSMVRTNKIFEEKKADIINNKVFTETVLDQMNKKLDFEAMSAKPQLTLNKDTPVVPSITYTESFRNIDGSTIEITFDDNNKNDVKHYGKLFLWENMLPEEDHTTFIEKSRMLKDINQAILNDLEDYYIIEGLKPSGADYILDRTSAINKMNMLNEKIDDEMKKGLPESRPPHLWNEPQSLKEDHDIRFSTNIFNETTYKGIKELYLYIENVASKLKSFDEYRWKKYVDAAITPLINIES